MLQCICANVIWPTSPPHPRLNVIIGTFVNPPLRSLDDMTTESQLDPMGRKAANNEMTIAA